MSYPEVDAIEGSLLKRSLTTYCVPYSTLESFPSFIVISVMTVHPCHVPCKRQVVSVSSSPPVVLARSQARVLVIAKLFHLQFFFPQAGFITSLPCLPPFLPVALLVSSLPFPFPFLRRGAIPHDSPFSPNPRLLYPIKYPCPHRFPSVLPVCPISSPGPPSTYLYYYAHSSRGPSLITSDRKTDVQKSRTTRMHRNRKGVWGCLSQKQATSYPKTYDFLSNLVLPPQQLQQLECAKSAKSALTRSPKRRDCCCVF